MPVEQTWMPIRQGSVSDLIAERILDVIAKGSLHPGDRLPPERELASMLGASRPSLREALRSLKAQGRVDVRHGTGVFVAEPETTRSLRAALYAEEADIEELFDMREVLELPAAAWAARNGDVRKLQAVSEAYETVTAASLEPDVDWQRLQALDASFHLCIVEAAGNRFLARTQGVLQQILSRCMETTLRTPGRMEQSRGDHRRIYDAILAGDSSAARRAAMIHVQGARRAALKRMHEESEGSRAANE